MNQQYQKNSRWDIHEKYFSWNQDLLFMNWITFHETLYFSWPEIQFSWWFCILEYHAYSQLFPPKIITIININSITSWSFVIFVTRPINLLLLTRINWITHSIISEFGKRIPQALHITFNRIMFIVFVTVCHYVSLIWMYLDGLVHPES